MKSLKQQRIDQLVIGFALFSMFFGAGNIIFPPYLGMGSGNLWGLGFLCYYMADIGIAILAIFALIRNGGEISTITTRIGKVPGEIMLSAIILASAPSSPFREPGLQFRKCSQNRYSAMCLYGLPAGSSFCWSCF